MFLEWFGLAIYARISSDRDGDELGSAARSRTASELAARQGWQVAERYVDADISAYSGKRGRRTGGCWTDICGAA